MNEVYAGVGLILYFAVLLWTVTRGKKNKNSEDFFFGGRKLPFWALSITFVASWWGAGSVLSTADLAYKDGMGAFFYYGVPVLISTFLMILGAKGIRKVGYLTQGKMMEVRYSKKVSKMLSLMILVFMTFNAAAQMVGIGKFFGMYLGIGYEISVILGTIIVFIYSMFGGFRAVVLTDIIQFVLLGLSAIVILGVAMYYSGGFESISQKADALGKVGYMSMTSGMSKYAVYVITFGFSWMIQANVWQRISAAKNDMDAKKMAILSFFVFIPLYLMVVIIGMAGLVIFPKFPEGGVVVTLTKNYMSPFIGTLVFVGIAAAIMSTMDSLINTGAMTIVLDLIKDKEDDAKAIKYSKFATLGVSVVALLIAMKFRSILDVSWFASDVITTGIFVPLVAGFFWKRGNSKGAYASMIWGLCYCAYNFIINLGLNLPHFWNIQSEVQVIFGVIVSVIIYITVSLFTKSEFEYEKAENFIREAGIVK